MNPRLPTAPSKTQRATRAYPPALGIGLLLLAALFWGSGNVANKTVLAYIGPFTALALRTLIAAVILLPLLASEGRVPRNRAWWNSALCVTTFFILAAGFQQVAYQWTTVTNASFLVNTCVVLTPLLAWCVLRQRPEQRIVLAGTVTLAGAWLMTGMPSDFSTINMGDAACLVSALFYGAWAIALGHHAMRHGRPVALTLVQFAVAAIVLMPLALLIEGPTPGNIIAAGPEILFLAVFSTAGACFLTTIAQRSVPPSVAVVVLSTESLFGTSGAVLFLDEVASATVLMGGALILVATLIAVGVKVHFRAERRVAPQAI